MNTRILDDRNIARLLIAVFLLSGFSGLIYQSIWTHYLKLFLGHAAYAQALVIATFMGGLALGSWWAARLTSSGRSLLLMYALAELLVGIYALVFHDIFVVMMDLAFDTLLPAQTSLAVAFMIKWGMALLLILPPSILLGTTFPLMAEGLIRRRPRERGRVLALLYFTNSLGAAAGILVSGFVLIRTLGLPGTVATAGGLNIVVALMAVAIVSLAKLPERAPVEDPIAPAAISKNSVAAILLLSCAGFTGLASFIYELTWIRMLSMLLGSATHSFEIMLASFVLGLAIGGWLIRNRIDGVRRPLVRLAWIQVAMGVLAAGTVLIYNSLFGAMHGLILALDSTEQGYYLFKLGGMALAMVVMLPTTICAGMTLPLITASLARFGYGERAVGHVYAINTLGAIGGVAITIGLLIPWLGLRNTLLVGAAIDIALAMWLLASSANEKAPSRGSWVFATAGMVCLVLIQFGSEFDTKRMSSGVFRGGDIDPVESEVLFHRDGRTATASVWLTEGSHMAIKTNGKTDASIDPSRDEPSGDEETMLLLALLGMAANPTAEDVAVIGFGMGLTTSTVLANPNIRRVDTIEIEPAMIEGAKQFGDVVARAFNDERSHIHIDDAKTFFSTHQKQYDIITAEPSNPWVSGVSGLFSQEHYQRVKQHLRPGGVYTQWVQLYEFNLDLLLSIVKAFAGEFDDYALYSGGGSDLLMLGTVDGKLGELSEDVFQANFMHEKLNALRIKNVADLQGHRIIGKPLLDNFLGVNQLPANSDYYPYVDQHAEEAFFRKSDAKDIIKLRKIWLLTDPALQKEVLESHTKRLGTGLTRSSFDAVFLQRLFKDNLSLERYGNKRVPVEAYEKAVSVSRMLYRCNPYAVEDSWLKDALWLSDITTIYGVPDLITPFWEVLTNSECFPQLPEQVQSAFRFFLAASQRNDLHIIHEAKLLADNQFGLPGFNDYVVLHVLAAYKRLDRPIAAAGFVSTLKDPSKLQFENTVLATHLVDEGRKRAAARTAQPITLR
jgi:spermidine synthase